MRCATCNQEASHIRVAPDGSESCVNCGGFAEAGGPKTTNLITRNSFRIRRQSQKYEGDFVMPHKYNKASRKLDVNPDFIKQFPGQAKEYFEDGELAKAGHTKLPGAIRKQKQRVAEVKAKIQESVVFEGSSKKAVERAIKK